MLHGGGHRHTRWPAIEYDAACTCRNERDELPDCWGDLAGRCVNRAGEVAVEQLGRNVGESGFVIVFDNDRERAERFVEQRDALLLQRGDRNTDDRRCCPTLPIVVEAK